MKMQKEEIPEALSRSLSGLQEDPWLAQRILSSENRTKPMKKKKNLSLILVSIMLFSFTVVAFAATDVYKTITINQKAEIIEEQEVEIHPEATPTPKPVTDIEAAWAQEQEYLANAPEDQFVEVILEGRGSSRGPQRTILSESEFNTQIDGYDYLTRPAFIPEGYHFEMAPMLLGCNEAGEFLSKELRQEDNIYYARYSIADGYEVIIGYDMTYRNEEGQYINIYDALSEYTEDDEYLFSFPEEYDYHSIDLPGMEYSISISGNGWNQIHMMQKLNNSIVCMWYPEKAKTADPDKLPDYFTYQSEQIVVSSNYVDIGVLTSMYSNHYNQK